MKLVGAMLAALMPALFGQAALAGQGTPTQVTVDDRTVLEGDPVTVRGTGWGPGTTVRILLGDRELGRAAVESDGRFAQEITMPADQGSGEVDLAARGADQTGDPTVLSVSVRVSEGTPRGTFVMIGIVAGIVLLILVVGFVLVRARRRPPDTLAEDARAGRTPVRNPDPRHDPQPERPRRA